MEFEQDLIFKKLGIVIGFLFSFFLFTTVLYYVFILFDRIPKSYFHIMAVTLIVLMIGLAIRRILR